MKFVDWLFIGILTIGLILCMFVQSLSTYHKLHIDEDLNVAFITNSGNGIIVYDGDSIKFSTGESYFIPNRKDTDLSTQRNKAIVFINHKDQYKKDEIISQMVNKKYIRSDKYNVIVLPFDMNLKKLKYVILNDEGTGDEILNKRIKIKKHDLDLVPPID